VATACGANNVAECEMVRCLKVEVLKIPTAVVVVEMKNSANEVMFRSKLS